MIVCIFYLVFNYSAIHVTCKLFHSLLTLPMLSILQSTIYIYIIYPGYVRFRLNVHKAKRFDSSLEHGCIK